jgi:hypothetical protein
VDEPFLPVQVPEKLALLYLTNEPAKIIIMHFQQGRLLHPQDGQNLLGLCLVHL